MSVAAVMLVKDEADVIGFTVDWLLSQVDEVFVADNGSTDGTREILNGLAHTGRVFVTDDPEVGYYQADKTTALAREAGARGHSWILPCDADEFWRTVDRTRIADLLDGLPPEIWFVTADLYDHKVTPLDPQDEADPRRRIGWRFVRQSKLSKVCCRFDSSLRIGMGNHEATLSGGAIPQISSTGSPPTRSLLVVEHYSWRSEEQMVKKIRNGAAAYAASSLPEQYGAHWRAFGSPDDPGFDDAVRGWFRAWGYTAEPFADRDLVFAPFPFPGETP